MLWLGRGQGAQEAHAGFLHEAPGTHAGKQRHLRVKVHHLIARLDDELKGAIVIFHHALGGQAQGNGLTAQGRFLAQPADHRQQRDGWVEVAGREVRMRAFIIQAGLGVNQRALDVEGLHLAVAIQVKGPQHGRLIGARQQRGSVLGKLRWVQARGFIGKIDGLAAAEGFALQLAAGLNESGNVRDGIKDAVSALAFFDINRLIQVHGAGGIQGHEGNFAGIAARVGVSVLRAGGLGGDLGRKIGGYRKFCGNGAEIERGGIELHAHHHKRSRANESAYKPDSV